MSSPSWLRLWVKRFFGTSQIRRPAPHRRTVSLGLESLEDRQLLSASAVLASMPATTAAVSSSVAPSQSIALVGSPTDSVSTSTYAPTSTSSIPMTTPLSSHPAYIGLSSTPSTAPTSPPPASGQSGSSILNSMGAAALAAAQNTAPAEQSGNQASNSNSGGYSWQTPPPGVSAAEWQSLSQMAVQSGDPNPADWVGFAQEMTQLNSQPPSSGSSGSNGVFNPPSPPNNTTSSPNADGSTVTTNSDGSKTISGQNADGSTWTQTTNADGTTTTTTNGQNADGSSWTQTQNSNGSSSSSTSGTNSDGSFWSQSSNSNGYSSSTTSGQNADGSTWTQTKNSDGSTSSTTSGQNSDGSTWTQTTNSDGKGNSSSTSTTSGTNSDGSSWSQTINSDGSRINTTSGQNADGSSWTQTQYVNSKGQVQTTSSSSGTNSDGTTWSNPQGSMGSPTNWIKISAQDSALFSDSPPSGQNSQPSNQTTPITVSQQTGVKQYGSAAQQEQQIQQQITQQQLQSLLDSFTQQLDQNPASWQNVPLGTGGSPWINSNADTTGLFGDAPASKNSSAPAADPLQQLANQLGVPLSGIYGNDLAAVMRAAQAQGITANTVDGALQDLNLLQAALNPNAPMPSGLDGNQQATFNNLRATGDANQTFIPPASNSSAPGNNGGAGQSVGTPSSNGWQPYQFPNLVPTSGDPTNAVSFDPNAPFNRSFLDEAARLLNAPTAFVNGALQGAANVYNFFNQSPAQQAQQINDALDTWKTGAQAIAQDPLGSLLSALSGMSNNAANIGGGAAAFGMVNSALPGAFGAAATSAADASAGTVANRSLADTFAQQLQQAQAGEANARAWLNGSVSNTADASAGEAVATSGETGATAGGTANGGVGSGLGGMTGGIGEGGQGGGFGGGNAGQGQPFQVQPLLLPAPLPANVIPNALTPAEATQAGEIVNFKGGEYMGPPTSSFPGIDGWLNGAEVTLKETTSQSPAAVLRYASEAEAEAAAAGYSGIEVYIKAPNLSAARLLDFATTPNSNLPRIATQGTISAINVLTADGWVRIPGN